MLFQKCSRIPLISNHSEFILTLQLVYHCFEISCSKMSFARPLCVLCERPTADGAVQAVQLDKDKLQTWFFNVCGYEFAEEIEETDLICNFCIWHAEFLAKHDGELESLAWWPQDLIYLDDKAKELREKYLEGKAEQCWVQLEKIELPKSEEEEIAEHGTKSDGQKSKKKCFYCGQVVANISSHVRNMHVNAIRCDYHRCATYFHTAEEKETHTKEVHEKSKAKKLIKCNFCEQEFRSSNNVREHIRRAHPKFRVKCKFFGCLSYFKSESEMNIHFDAVHKEEDEAKVYNCHHCEFKSKFKNGLLRHISRLHLPKTIKCDECHMMFATRQILAKHAREKHWFRVCSICKSDVIAINMSYHLKRGNCKRCKNEFECLGLYKSHWKTCKITLLKCDQCPKAFQKPAFLDYHVKRKHGKNSWRGLQHKNLGFKCAPCKRYYKSEKQLKIHLNHFHKRLNLKHCAHCPKSFTDFVHLKNHLAVEHNLIEGKFECGECQKKFVSKYFLASHKRYAHLLSKKLKSCTVCGKTMGEKWLNTHLLTIHGVSKP